MLTASGDLHLQCPQTFPVEFRIKTGLRIDADFLWGFLFEDEDLSDLFIESVEGFLVGLFRTDRRHQLDPSEILFRPETINHVRDEPEPLDRQIQDFVDGVAILGHDPANQEAEIDLAYSAGTDFPVFLVSSMTSGSFEATSPLTEMII